MMSVRLSGRNDISWQVRLMYRLHFELVPDYVSAVDFKDWSLFYELLSRKNWIVVNN